MIVTAIGVFVTSGMALVRLGLLPSGFVVCSWIILLSVVSYRQQAETFRPGPILSAWMYAGDVSWRFQWAYVLSIFAAMILCGAAILATVGYIRSAKEDLRRAEQERQQQSQEMQPHTA
jgi:hypothetical protein